MVMRPIAVSWWRLCGRFFSRGHFRLGGRLGVFGIDGIPSGVASLVGHACHRFG
jgi:hypothetical protein